MGENNWIELLKYNHFLLLHKLPYTGSTGLFIMFKSNLNKTQGTKQRDGLNRVQPTTGWGGGSGANC